MTEPVFGDHPFVAGLDPEHLDVLAHCVVDHTRWEAGGVILRRGDEATACHLVVEGMIAIEIRPPGGTPRTIQTLHAGDLLGWSWLFEPHLWTFDARVVSPASAFTLDAGALRQAIEDDCEFGIVVVQRVAKAVVNRLKATRLQVLDVYNR